MKKVDAGKEINEAADSRSFIELTKKILKLLAFSRKYHGGNKHSCKICPRNSRMNFFFKKNIFILSKG